MNTKVAFQYSGMILKVFVGLTVIFWGYEKLALEKLVSSYNMDYGNFMLFDVHTFLQIAGWMQIIFGALLILGLFTRVNAILLSLMGVITIIIPGMIVLKDVPHFAYAFAFTGASLVLMLEGGGPFSLDHLFVKRIHK